MPGDHESTDQQSPTSIRSGVKAQRSVNNLIMLDLPLEDLGPREHILSPEPLEDTVAIQLEQDPKQSTKRGTRFRKEEAAELERLLVDNRDVFA